MKTRMSKVLVIVGLSLVFLSVFSGIALAKAPVKAKATRRVFARRVVSLPKRHEVVKVRGRNYHYHNGRFFQKGLFGYVVVRPPMGAIVFSLPLGHAKIIFGGVTYFCHEDVYYRPAAGGYVVVPAPAAVISQVTIAPSVVAGPAVASEKLIINIPNSNGSYTAVTLKRTGPGYIGPQGEYYPEHPTVEQLKVLYGS